VIQKLHKKVTVNYQFSLAQRINKEKTTNMKPLMTNLTIDTQ